MSTKKTSTHKLYIDVLNVIACLAVVILHTNGAFWGFSYEPYWISANVIESIFYFAVPIFFMITGATLLDYRDKYNTKVFFEKRIKKTVIPFIVWSIIAVIYYQIFKDINIRNCSVVEIINGVINTKYVSVYWYFISLFTVYLCVPILSIIPQKKECYLYIVVLAFILNITIPFISKLSCNSFDINLKMPLGNEYLFYVLIGYLIAHYEIPLKYRKIIYILGMLGFSMHCVGTWYLSYEMGDVVETFKGYLNVPCVLYSIAIFLFFKRISYQYWNLKVIKLIEYFNTATFGIYLSHWYIIDRFLELTNWKYNKTFTYRFIGGIMIFFITGIIIKKMQKINFIRKLLFPN